MTARPEREESVRGWLRYAQTDLDAAEHLSRGPGSDFPRIVGFHVQQAIEKWIKAVLTHAGVHFPRSHDLTELLALAPKDFNPPVDASLLERITDYAVMTRYPDPDEPISNEEIDQTLRAARSFGIAVEAYLPDLYSRITPEDLPADGEGSEIGRR